MYSLHCVVFFVVIVFFLMDLQSLRDKSMWRECVRGNPLTLTALIFHRSLPSYFSPPFSFRSFCRDQILGNDGKRLAANGLG